jgi:hypothetical protein
LIEIIINVIFVIYSYFKIYLYGILDFKKF